MFAAGKAFPNFMAFETAMKELEAHQNTIFVQRSSNKTNNPEMTHLKYEEAVFECKHGTIRKTQSKGIRPNQRSLKLGCKAKVRIKAKKVCQQWQLVVTRANLTHCGHVPTAEKINSKMSKTKNLKNQEKQKSKNEKKAEQKSKNEMLAKKKFSYEKLAEQKTKKETKAEKKSKNEMLAEDKSKIEKPADKKSKKEIVAEQKSKNAIFAEEKSKDEKLAEEKSTVEILAKKKRKRKIALKLLNQEFDKSKMARCQDNGPGDLSLLNAVTMGKFQDLQIILRDETCPCSTTCLNKCLILSSFHGSQPMMLNLLSSGANPNCTDDSGNTPLMICALHGFLDMAKLLVRQKADVNMCNRNGDTALMFSLKESGLVDLVRLLLNKSTISKKNNKGYTPLIKAIEVSDISAIKLLIMEGASVSDSVNGETPLDIANKKGLGKLIKVYVESKAKNEPPLMVALRYRDVCLMETICFIEPNCVNVRNSCGESALDAILQTLKNDTKPISTNDKSVVQFLLQHGVEVNQSDSKKPKGKPKVNLVDSPLVQAIYIGDPDVVRWLCLCGADVDQTFGMELCTPLMLATKLNQLNIVKVLISNEANIDSACKEGNALDIAIRNGFTEISKLLIEVFGEKNIKDAFELAIDRKGLKFLEHLAAVYPSKMEDFSLVKLAFQTGDMQIIKCLTGPLGLDKDSTRLLLHNAVLSDQLDLVRTLIECNVDVNLRDDEGDTPLHKACSGDSPEYMVKLLLSSGADMNVKNQSGKTAFFLASERNKPDVVHAFLEKENKNTSMTTSGGRISE